MVFIQSFVNWGDDGSLTGSSYRYSNAEYFKSVRWPFSTQGWVMLDCEVFYPYLIITVCIQYNTHIPHLSLNYRVQLLLNSPRTPANSYPISIFINNSLLFLSCLCCTWECVFVHMYTFYQRKNLHASTTPWSWESNRMAQ